MTNGGTSSIEGIIEAILDPVDALVREFEPTMTPEAIMTDWVPRLAKIGITPDQAASGMTKAAFSCTAFPTLSQIIALTLGDGWRESIVMLPKVMIGVGKIYTDAGLAVIYPYIFSGTVEVKRGALIDGKPFMSKEEAVENIKRFASREGALERFAEKHATGRTIPQCSDVMYFKKYPEVWDKESWGELPGKGKPNKKCPIISLN